MPLDVKATLPSLSRTYSVECSNIPVATGRLFWGSDKQVEQYSGFKRISPTHVQASLFADRLEFFPDAKQAMKKQSI